MATSRRDPATYAFGPLERRNVFGGLRTSQMVVLGVMLTLAVVLLQFGSSPFLILGAIVMTGGGIWAAFVPIRSRTLDEWAPIVLAYNRRRLTGRLSFRSRAPQNGVLIDPEDGDVEHAEELPEELGDIELLDAPLEPGSSTFIGVTKDRRAMTYTATLAVQVRSFGLLADAEQERRLAAWGTVLAGLARDNSPIRRIAWLERTVPNDGDELASYLQEARDEHLPLASSPVRSYIELLETATDVTQDHEIFVSLQIDARRAWRSIKRLGGGDEGATRLLVRELDTFARRLDGAGITVLGALTRRLLARALRDGFDPFGRKRRARLGNVDPERAGTHPTRAWPVAREANWASYHADSARHVTYWISEWPKIDVGATFLQPLLMQTNVVRTVSVVMEAVPPSQAIPQIEQARTADIAEEETRIRLGQTTTARHRQKADATAQRESELAAGHAELRYAGYVTVSAPYDDDEGFERACAEVEHAAHQSRLALEPMFGQQEFAFTFSLPLCRGLG